MVNVTNEKYNIIWRESWHNLAGRAIMEIDSSCVSQISQCINRKCPKILYYNIAGVYEA